MADSEFSLIQRYFCSQRHINAVNRLGIGDDCALMSVPDGYELAITTDTMVEGIHFFADVDPASLGHKLLAVNLSDLAAMGASPVSVTLALTLPNVNESWLQAFSKSFLNLARTFSVDLIGGDTTTGPLTLTVQALGLVPEGQALKRSGAKVGDLVFVTGRLGDAGLGLKIYSGYQCSSTETALNRFDRPSPRVNEGLAIRKFASSCIDLSDGLASDLKHIAEKSFVGVKIDWDSLPLSNEVKRYIDKTEDWALPLVAGDDYELCFTVSPEKVDSINVNCTQIGVVEAQLGMRLQRLGVVEKLEVKGFEHFSS